MVLRPDHLAAAEGTSNWGTYQSAWRDIDPEERRVLLQESVSAEGDYLDPQSETHGLDQLAAHIAAFVASAPGLRFENYQFLSHHSQSMASWNLVGPDGDLVTKGGSHASYDSDGKLVNITGFFSG